jgi:hypothetical protein
MALQVARRKGRIWGFRRLLVVFEHRAFVPDASRFFNSIVAWLSNGDIRTGRAL